ncbi:MAG: right-handed parallel beta-helix repeat-containing protein [Lachnospiraceae bacterium]|nr:right-handed parallel beta-helix repeat-containing protein [Lachnospiraceae bacterium]
MKKHIVKTMVFAVALVGLIQVPVKAETKTVNITVTNPADAGKEIQDQLDQAKYDSSGINNYVFNFPKGELILKDTVLKVYSYSTLNLDGCTLKRVGTEKKWKSMLRIGNATGEDTGDVLDKGSKGYEGYHDIKIIGGTFDGNGSVAAVNNNDSPTMLRFGHGYNLTFEGVTFKNPYDNHHMEFAACKGITIKNCVFEGFTPKKGKTGAKAVNYANNEAVQFDIMHNSAHFTQYPEYDDTPCQDIVVDGCTFTNLQRGLGTHSAVAGSYFNNIQFTNNNFSNITGYAIAATNFKNATISGNTITDCGAGIIFRTMVQSHDTFYAPLAGSFTVDYDAASVITGNTILVTDKKYTNAIAYGVSLYGEVVTEDIINDDGNDKVPKGNFTLKGVTVSDNTITMKNSGYGIWLQNADACVVSGNTVTMNVATGVSGKGNCDPVRLVKSKNNSLINNTLEIKKKNKKTKKACGVVITTKSSATLTGNTIKNACKDGIFVVTKSSAVVKSNKVLKTGRYGLNVCEKSNARSIKNTFKKCKKRHYNEYNKSKIKKK